MKPASQLDVKQAFLLFKAPVCSNSCDMGSRGQGSSPAQGLMMGRTGPELELSSLVLPHLCSLTGAGRWGPGVDLR
jgi:hypothetical protein